MTLLNQLDSNFMDPALIRSIPFNYDAEKGVLSAFFLDNSFFDEFAPILTSFDFYDNRHRIIFDSMVRLRDKNFKIDFISVQEDLDLHGLLQDVGGRIFLIAFQEDISSLGMIDQYVEILREKSHLRHVISSASKIISRCYDRGGVELHSVVEDAERMLFDIANRRDNKKFLQLEICLKRAFDDLVNTKTSFKGITGVPTGFSCLDDLTGGFQNGDFIVLAARPSMGKTALSLSFVMSAASFDYPVGFVSLEMGAEQISLRLLSSCARVRLASLRSAQLSAEDWSSITSAAAKLARKKIFIDDTASQTVSDIRTKARKLKIEHNIKLLVIDYLQLISPTKKHDSRQQEVSEISRSLKILAKDLGIPIIALSQLSRGVESRIDKRPLLSDLRDSGAIEQDADLIMFLYRDSVYNAGEQSHEGTAEIILGKQRNGPTGTMHIKYLKEFTLFHE